MKIVTEHARDSRVCVIRLDGDVDMATSPDVRAALEGAVNRGCLNVVLDLSGVTYADSTALGTIVWMDRILEPKGGRLVLAGATRNVTRILELSGLVDIAPTVSSAGSASDAVAGLELPDPDDEPLWARTIELAADSASLAAIRNEVCAVLEPLAMTEAALFDVRVAVGEAVSNAIRHGSPGGERDRVVVEVAAYPDRAVLVVRDRGAGFDGSADDGADLYAPSGRGVMFMRALMDRVDFARSPDGGTVVTLVKHVSAETVVSSDPVR
jgi:anti-anti-sigma factor